ncbi:uncharacterized protein FOMMEDRAFT_24532, partial [Fomitiporia mediterranea MF3/22]
MFGVRKVCAFHALFATKDQKEGMSAFVEKKPKFSNLRKPSSEMWFSFEPTTL